MALVCLVFVILYIKSFADARRNRSLGKVVETDASLQDLVKADDVIYVRESLF
jgi:hypothetical protein